MSKTSKTDLVARRDQALTARTDVPAESVKEIAGSLTALRADVFTLYLKTKNFHWHMSGPHFRDYHLLLDEQGEQLFAITDGIAERVRKIGGTTLQLINHMRARRKLLTLNLKSRWVGSSTAFLCNELPVCRSYSFALLWMSVNSKMTSIHRH